MKPDNTLTKKSKRTVPHIYALLFAIIVVCTILTWILPAGQFDRVDDVVVAGTFHAVESTPVGLFQMFQLIHTASVMPGASSSSSSSPTPPLA